MKLVKLFIPLLLLYLFFACTITSIGDPQNSLQKLRGMNIFFFESDRNIYHQADFNNNTKEIFNLGANSVF